MRMAMLDAKSIYQVFSPFLGVSVCPSAIMLHKLSKLNSSASEESEEKGNDLAYIARNYKHIYEA